MYIELEINRNGLIDGDSMREICEVFPELEDCFEQRKTYDEYYYKYPVSIEVSMEQIQQLMDMRYEVSFLSDTMRINY